MPRITLAALSLVTLLSSGCAPPAPDLAAEARSLLQRDAEWAQAASEGKDIEKILSFWSEDAQVIEPGQPVYAGKAALRAYVTASLKTPGFRIHWVSDHPVFSPDRQLAYMSGTEEMTVPGPGGALMSVHSRGISIWRRDADGQWRCVIDVANEPPPA